MIKAVFFDIDGTLLDKHGKILPSTKKAIKEMKKKGIICGVATGRGPSDINKQIRNLGLDIFITYNGQFIYDNTGEVIFSGSFEVSLLHKIMFYVEQKNIPFLLGINNRTEGSYLLKISGKKWVQYLEYVLPKYLSKKLEAIFKYFFRLSKKRKKNNEFNLNKSILQEAIYQCVALCDEQERRDFEIALPECTFTCSNEYTTDIIPKSGSKARGIEKVAQYYNIQVSEIMAFGDSCNDIAMLKLVGIGIAMGNALPEVQNVAIDKTNSNNQNGISKALYKYKVLQGENNGKN